MRLAVLVLLAAAVGCGSNQAKDAPPKANGTPAPSMDQPIVVEAGILFGTYNSSEREADKKYTGKLVEVTGTITEIRPDRVGLTVFGRRYTPNIVGFLSAEGKKQATKYSVNNEVRLMGTCEGATGEDSKGFVIVTLKNCRLADSLK